MNYKGYHVLKSMIDENYTDHITYIVSRRDKHVARDYFEEIQETCLKNNLLFFEKEKPSDVTEDYKMAIGWRWLISDYANLIILHDSLLPKFRGFAPLVNALINGEKKAGVTMLFAGDEYDTGDIIFQESIDIHYPITIQQLIEKITPIYVSLSKRFFQLLEKGEKVIGKKQEESKASYSLWRDEEDYHIDWHKSAKEIQRFIHALGFPYKGAFSMVNGKKIRIIDVQIKDDVDVEIRQPGKTIFTENGMPVVVCGKGLIKIVEMYDDYHQPINKLNFRTRFL